MQIVRTLAQLTAAASLAALPTLANAQDFVGAVYAMTNDFNANTVAAYGRADDGTLTPIGEFATGGQGAAFDGGEGLDPLISAYALLLTDDNRFLLAANAGSNTLTAFKVEEDFSLTRTDEARVFGAGINSVAYSDGLVYVSIIDADGVFDGEPDQEGALVGFELTDRGRLVRVERSARLLGNRPSAVRFSPDGEFLVVSSINAGSNALASGSVDEIVSYRVQRNGRLAPIATGRATSTLPNNREGRNLPSAIGFEIVAADSGQYVVVTEAREFSPEGNPPAFPALQTGSVSTWRLNDNGTFAPISLDVLAGNDFFDGELTTCWIEFNNDASAFWVSNAIPASLSAYSFNNGEISLVDVESARGTPGTNDDPFGTTDGWIDLDSSADGRYVYQLYGLDGTIGVYAVNGTDLTLIQEVSDLPEVNTQGIVAF
ncbi:MAG: hypothetical protein AAFX85_08905 [Pseudomonadota bacterium]